MGKRAVIFNILRHRAKIGLGIYGLAIFVDRVFAQNHIGCQRFEQINKDRQLFIVALDQFTPISSSVPIFGNDGLIAASS